MNRGTTLRFKRGSAVPGMPAGSRGGGNGGRGGLGGGGDGGGGRGGGGLGGGCRKATCLAKSHACACKDGQLIACAPVVGSEAWEAAVAAAVAR